MNCLPGGLTEYIHSNERSSSLIDLNKEGIFSLPGYWSLHLWGAAIGQSVLWYSQRMLQMAEMEMKKKDKGYKPGLRALGLWGCPILLLLFVALALLIACRKYIDPVSRRSCNATYIVWMICITLFIITCASISEICGNTSTLMSAFGTSMLWVFLFANLATGAVNFSVNTLEVSDNAARGILGKTAPAHELWPES